MNIYEDLVNAGEKLVSTFVDAKEAHKREQRRKKRRLTIVLLEIEEAIK